MNTQIHELGLFAMADAVAQRRLRSVDLVESCLDRIAEREPQIRAWKWLDPRTALTAARQRDREPISGPLHGVPLAVKDIIDTADMPTAYGSPVYEGWRPAWDASCVALSRRAGAVVLGKTVSTEFAYFAPGPTANPHNLSHTPGGSSSGSAAAVADFMVPAGFGTQTAASVTRPASYCGVVGYKASYGDFSLAGIKSFAGSFDSLGSFTRHVVDAQWLRWALMGERRDARTSVASTAPRIGLCRTPSWDAADTECRQAVEAAARILSLAGSAVFDVELPSCFGQLVQHHKNMMAYEAARSLAFEYDKHRSMLSPQIRQLLEHGQSIAREDYVSARQAASAAQREFDMLMGDYDVILAPSAPGVAPAGLLATGDPIFSRMWTLLGVPSVTLPSAVAGNGLPIGVQLVGRFGADELLLAIARWAEPSLCGPPT
ncbi:MAG: amidase [Polaromonas sp.]|nr:amidase [Polaromonas sp.]